MGIKYVRLSISIFQNFEKQNESIELYKSENDVLLPDMFTLVILFT